MPEIAVSCPKTLELPSGADQATLANVWYVVYTSSRHEKSVVRHFHERDIETFLPLYRKQHHWNKRRNVELDLPLFPNYVFVRIAAQQRIPLLCVPGVLGLVGGKTPSALSHEEIEALRAGLAWRRFEPHPYLVDGQRVRIRSGALAGMQGILLRYKSELRVVLTISLIQRSVVAEMDATDVEPVFTC